MLGKILLGLVLAACVAGWTHFSPPRHHILPSDLSPMFRGGESGDWVRSSTTGLWLYTSSEGSGEAGAVVIAHGYAQHSGMFGTLSSALSSLGFRVVSFDHQGHGKSEGDRLFVTRFDDYTADLVQMAQAAAIPGKPLFVFGHSLGGLMALRVALAEPQLLTGMVLSGPALAIDPQINTTTTRWAAAKFADILPHLPVARVVLDNAYSDPEKEAAARADPLVCAQCWSLARTGNEALLAIEHTLANARSIKTPYLILQGSDDHHALPIGSQTLHQRASAKDASYISYPGFAHELLDEPEGHRVLDDILSWIKERM